MNVHTSYFDEFRGRTKIAPGMIYEDMPRIAEMIGGRIGKEIMAHRAAKETCVDISILTAEEWGRWRSIRKRLQRERTEFDSHFTTLDEEDFDN